MHKNLNYIFNNLEMRKDAVSEALRKDDVCKKILQDLVDSFPPGKKFLFNKSGYISYVMTKLLPYNSIDSDRIVSSFKFYQEHRLAEIGENTIETKEKALNYV
jgi:hypothetical protein